MDRRIIDREGDVLIRANAYWEARRQLGRSGSRRTAVRSAAGTSSAEARRRLNRGQGDGPLSRTALAAPAPHDGCFACYMPKPVGKGSLRSRANPTAPLSHAGPVISGTTAVCPSVVASPMAPCPHIGRNPLALCRGRRSWGRPERAASGPRRIPSHFPFSGGRKAARSLTVVPGGGVALRKRTAWLLPPRLRRR